MSSMPTTTPIRTTSSGRAARRSARRRFTLPLAACAVVGLMLPLGVSPAGAAQSVGQPVGQSGLQQKAEPGFAGYAARATGAPVKIEIFEPTIPLPNTPQAELSMGYSAIVADSTSARSRASFLWPGDPVGEGFKTILENLGLPPELVAPLAENGYPVQVNAVFPGGPETETDEPFPGSIQRATAKEGSAVASNGFSSDGEVKDEPGKGGGNGDDSPLPGLPGLPGLPELPGLPLLDLPLPGLGSGGLGGLLGSSTAPAAGPRAAAAAPGLPPELAILLDVGGFSSISRTSAGDDAVSQARANVGDISLLGGLVTIEGVKTLARTTSNGKKGVAEGEASYGDLVAFGQRFRFGPDGYEAVGQKGVIPGLPDQAAEALEMIGLKVTVPKPTLTTDGDAATAAVQGLIIDFDLTTLKTQLGPVTDLLNTLALEIPDQAGPLKSLLQAAANLSPRIVFTLGMATTAVDTSQAIELPPLEVPDVEPPAEPTETAEPPASGGGGTSASTGGDAAPPLTDAPVGGETPVGTTDAGTVPVAAAQQPGLPALFSIPTLLILLGVGLASVFGSYVRRMGLAALGGSAACPHGLTSGIPDLRKMT